ncbi:MAG: trigger factor [Dehalococcoidia bacterium]
MKVSTDKIEGSQVVVNIEVEDDEMEGAIKQAYRRMGAKAAIPGFRKGKAPAAILEQYFGRDALVEDAAEHLLPEVYDRAIEEHGVEAIARPEVEILQTDPLAFKATVPVRPTIEFGDYHQIKFEMEAVVVTEEEEAEALEGLRLNRAPWEPVERAARFGDLLAIDVEGTVDGKTVIDEKGGWYQLSPDSASAIAGFAEQLEGAEKGEEEREFTLTLPPDRGEYGGQECSFKVRVSEVKQKNLPEVDDEFAKSLGQGLETVDALKERIAADLRARKEAEARSNLEEKAVNALVDLASLEFPDIMVQQEIDHLITERKRYLGDHNGLENYLNSVGKTEEEFRDEMRPIAERIVVRSLALQKFAELHGIEVGAAEIDAEVEHIREHSSDERVRKLLDSRSTRESLGRNLFIRKAIGRLVEMVTADEASSTSIEESVASQTNEEGDENGDTTQ